MLSAEEAHAYGMVNHVVEQADLLTKAQSILHHIASRSPDAVAAAIKAVNASLGDTQPGFEAEIKAFGQCFGTADFKEGVTAFLAKRKPNF